MKLRFEKVFTNDLSCIPSFTSGLLLFVKNSSGNNGNQLEKSYIYFSLYLVNLHGAFVAFLDIISMVICFIG